MNEKEILTWLKNAVSSVSFGIVKIEITIHQNEIREIAKTMTVRERPGAQNG